MAQQSSRLHRLLTLLDTGSTQATRFTAARQLGEIAKSHPQDLASLLKKVSQYLRSKNWDTRVAAAHAIGAIAQNVKHTSVSELIDSVGLKISEAGLSGTIEDVLAMPDFQSAFRSFDINNVLEFGALLASGGQEYDITSENIKNPKERLARQKQNLRRRLGLDVCEQFMDVNDMIRDEDLILDKVNMHGNGGDKQMYPSKSIQNIQQFVANMVPYIVSTRPSAREMNLLKRKAKINSKDQTKHWSEEGETDVACPQLVETPRGTGIFERFRGILHEGEIDKRVQFLIEGLFAIRKAKFEGYPAVRPELDLVEQEDQLTHEISLQEDIDPEIALDIFKADPNFLDNEKRYEDLKKNILGEESEDEEDRSDPGSDDEDEDEEDESEEDDEEQMQINDETETNLVNLRRTIYLTIMSSVDFEEAGHKLLKIKLEPGQEIELCVMLLECCSQERTYLRYYGLLGQRFCKINKVYQENFEKCFVQQYSMIHRLETNKLRNVAKFFAHLLGTDALPWHVLAYIRLTEEDTTSSSRIFIKILFQELSEHLGIRLLNERLTDSTMQDSFESIFPRDNPKNTRFSINFFTSIGLGGLTENLREYLKNMPRLIMQQQKPVSDSDEESGSSDSSDSDSSASESESDPSSSEESEGEEKRRGKKRRKTGR